MKKYIIRNATINDITRINELFIQMIQYVNEQNKKAGKIVDEERFKNGYEEGFLENYLSKSDKFILVSEIDSHIVGYLSCEEHKDETGKYIYLDDFCVDERFRGYGIGTKLLTNAYEYAQNNNYDNLRLHVEKENHKSINFYNNLDFKPVSNDNNRFLMQKEVIKENIYSNK